jgi:hypothetical protein
MEDNFSFPAPWIKEAGKVKLGTLLIKQTGEIQQNNKALSTRIALQKTKIFGNVNFSTQFVCSNLYGNIEGIGIGAGDCAYQIAVSHQVGFRDY